MKKLSLALGIAAASLLSLSTNAMAQTYVSGSLGLSRVNVDCSGAPSCDKSDVAFKLTGGYGVGSGVSAELGYIDFGKATLSGPGGSADIKVSGFTLGGAYLHPVAKNVDVTARLGLAYLKAKAFGESDSNLRPYIGFGGAYAINKNLKAEAGVDISRAKLDDESATVTAFTIGARYSF